MSDTVPPPGFDQPFFYWLDEMSGSLSVRFASPGCVPEPDVARLEQKIGRPLPADIRRFYTRYNPWDVLRDWFGWESTARTVSEAIGATAPLVPIDCRSYSSQGWDTVAVVLGSEQYEVIERWRATGAVRRYPDLRSYFTAAVAEESDKD
jgi:hypothetical protein